MAPEVFKRKLTMLSKYLKDLKDYENISFEDYMEHHYAIERIIELIVMTATDLILHLLKEKSEPAPISYSSAFLRAGELNLISANLAERLAKNAGLRNILVHQYEDTDHSLVHRSITNALIDYTLFVKEMLKVQQT